MKFYINLGLEVSKLSKVIHHYSELSLNDTNYLKYGVLNNKTIVNEFVASIADDKEICIYDYESLQLTLSEFGMLYDALHQKGIQLIFLNESPNFLPTLISIMSNNQLVVSNRVSKAMNIVIEQGEAMKQPIVKMTSTKTTGRPTIPSKRIEQIIFLREKEKRSIRSIATECDVSVGTVHKYIKNYNYSEKNI